MQITIHGRFWSLAFEGDWGAAFGAAFVDAVVTRGDSNDPKFLADIQKEAPFFVSLYERGNCAGTIIDNHHVLTAAHCVGEAKKAPKTILFDGSFVTPWAAFMNPDCVFSVQNDGPNRCDVAILAYDEDIVERVASAGGGAPLSLPVYPSSDEVGKTITLYGYGLSGDAADLTGKNGCNKAKDDGKFRRAQNIVTDTSDGVIRYRMDNGNGLNLEGMAQDGDSGGSATVTVGGTTYLVGANSGTMERNSCDYGSIDEYVRLSEHFDFVAKVLECPNDQTVSPSKEWKKPDKPCRPATSPPVGTPISSPTSPPTSDPTKPPTKPEPVASPTSPPSSAPMKSPTKPTPPEITTSAPTSVTTTVFPTIAPTDVSTTSAPTGSPTGVTTTEFSTSEPTSVATGGLRGRRP